MFGKYNGFVSKARVSACMYFLVYDCIINFYYCINGKTYDRITINRTAFNTVRNCNISGINFYFLIKTFTMTIFQDGDCGKRATQSSEMNYACVNLSKANVQLNREFFCM